MRIWKKQGLGTKVSLRTMIPPNMESIFFLSFEYFQECQTNPVCTCNRLHIMYCPYSMWSRIWNLNGEENIVQPTFLKIFSIVMQADVSLPSLLNDSTVNYEKTLPLSPINKYCYNYKCILTQYYNNIECINDIAFCREERVLQDFSGNTVVVFCSEISQVHRRLARWRKRNG